jgi:hypothetical protein
VEVMPCHAKELSFYKINLQVSGLAMLFTVAKVNVDGQGINVCNWI